MEEKTGYQLSVSVGESIVEIVIAGEINQQNIQKLHEEMIEILKRKDARAVLVDLRAAKTYQDSIAKAYFRVRSYPLDIIKMPAVIVDASKDAAFVSFFETTAANIGQTIIWFSEIEAGKEWLKSRF